MWLNIVNATLTFLFKEMGGRRFLGINFRLKKNCTIWAASPDHQKGKLHDHDAVVELLFELYVWWHRLGEITCHPHPHLAV